MAKEKKEEPKGKPAIPLDVADTMRQAPKPPKEPEAKDKG